MRKLLLLMCSAMLVFGVVGNAEAYSFDDNIETWYGADYVYLDESLDISNVVYDAVTGIPSVGVPFTYKHDIRQEVDFDAGHYVVDAVLSIGFTGADILEFCFGGDGQGIFQNRDEYVKFKLDGTSWVNLGEVDNGEAVSGFLVDVGLLNDNGRLRVKVDVYNDSGDADIGVDYSRLSGNAAVPEPATIFLLGTGLLGVAAMGRKRLIKKS